MLDIWTLVLEHIWITTLSCIALVGVTFGVWLKYTSSLWGKDFAVAFPVIGKMARWRKMIEGTGEPNTPSADPKASYVDRVLVVPAEKDLYKYYRDQIPLVSAAGFDRMREFLTLAHQAGRKPMSAFSWMILSLLTLAEAFGTGLLLAPLLSKSITPTYAFWAGTAIALAIAAIALMITHGAGEDMFRNTLLAKVRSAFRQDSGFRRMDGTSAGKTVIPIRPAHEQAIDEQNDVMARLASRIQATSQQSMAPRRLRMVLSVVFIVGFGVSTMAYRHYVYNMQQDDAASGASSSSNSTDFANMFGGSATPGATSQTQLPDAVAQAAAQSHAREVKSAQNDQAKANDAGILLLTLIYVFTQLIGILTGYRYSFFDDDTKKAYLHTYGEISYEAFLRTFIDPVAQRADLRLGQLRGRLSQENPAYREHQVPFNFIDAYRDEAERLETRQKSDKRTEQAAPPVLPASTSQVRADHVAAPVVAGPPTVVPFARPELVPDYDNLANAVLSADKAIQGQVLTGIVQNHNLDIEQQSALMEAIKRAKRSAANRPTVRPDLLSALEDE